MQKPSTDELRTAEIIVETVDLLTEKIDEIQAL